MDLGIFREHHIRVEQVLRVQQPLYLPHQLPGIMPPFQFYEGRHVATGAMFRFQRTAEFHGNELCHILHESFVASDFRGVVEALGEHKVQVSFKGVAKDDRVVITMLDEQRLEAGDPLG